MGLELKRELYEIADTDAIATPALVYYKDIIEANTQKVLAQMRGTDRLWPHVKSHKMDAVVRLQQRYGITRFKCATLSEAHMAAACGAQDVLLAYPLVGPNIPLFLSLQEVFAGTRFWAIGDDYAQLSLLAAQSQALGRETRLLIDVNIGMNRTGVPLDQTEAFWEKCAGLSGIELLGLHCFNGDYKIPDRALRERTIDTSTEAVLALQASLRDKGFNCSAIVTGGTASLPCYAKYEGIYYSPGTAFITDYAHYNSFRDLNFVPGAAILTRVVSRAADGLFTLDLGYKSVAADPAGERGVILGWEGAKTLFHCEEHWTFRAQAGKEEHVPRIGTLLYVIPTHICPTTALYPYALVAEHGKIVDRWEVTARNRQLAL